MKFLYQKVEEKFKKHPERLKHIYGVINMALKLSKIYRIDETSIEIAALLHDYTKYDSIDFHKMHMDYDTFVKYQNYPYVYHAISCANILKDEFQIDNHEIYQAIYTHVWGSPHMTLFDKVLLISDKIEETRTYDGVENLRKLAFENIDLAVIKHLEFLLESNVGPKNEILENIKKLKESIELERD